MNVQEALFACVVAVALAVVICVKSCNGDFRAAVVTADEACTRQHRDAVAWLQRQCDCSRGPDGGLPLDRVLEP